MLIDWSLAGPNGRFEIRVPNIGPAIGFYRDALGAQEAFRLEGKRGEPLRVGFTIGAVGFTVASDPQDEAAPSMLSEIARELGLSRLAVVLRVDNPEGVRQAALAAGGVAAEWPEAPPACVVGDPFGVHWAIIGR